jgi:hypothetical protein
VKVEEQVRYRGARCRQCAARYENGSAFFTHLNSNPRNFTPEQVPPVSEGPYWIRGETAPAETADDTSARG